MFNSYFSLPEGNYAATRREKATSSLDTENIWVNSHLQLHRESSPNPNHRTVRSFHFFSFWATVTHPPKHIASSAGKARPQASAPWRRKWASPLPGDGAVLHDPGYPGDAGDPGDPGPRKDPEKRGNSSPCHGDLWIDHQPYGQPFIIVAESSES